MILKPKITKEFILEGLLSDAMPRRISGPPESYEERVKAKEDLLKIVAKGGVMLHCIGCDQGFSVDDTAQCECGGFVCPACRAVETEGECHHDTSRIDALRAHEAD